MNCLDLAKLFLVQADQDGLSGTMTNMKINKLVYYAQCLNLALYGEPLFSEDIQAWIHGPVCYKVYLEYRQYIADPVRVPEMNDLKQISEKDIEIVEEVWQFLGDRRASQLRNMTHEEFPWLNARGGIPDDMPSQAVLSLEDMRARGEEMLNEIEKADPSYHAEMNYAILQALADDQAPIVTVNEMNEWLDHVLAEAV
jgi:uncharacterized phage-associated protein